MVSRARGARGRVLGGGLGIELPGEGQQALALDGHGFAPQHLTGRQVLPITLAHCSGPLAAVGLAERPLNLGQTILAVKHVAIDEIGRRAEHRAPNGFFGVGLVFGLDSR